MNAERILLTGGSGFLGSRLAVLAAGGGANVWATYLEHPAPEVAGVSPVRLDLAATGQVGELLEEISPGLVIHTAYTMANEAINIDATRELALASARLAKQPFFLFTSTDLIFDGRRGRYTEDDEPRPVMEYGRQKVEAERIVREALPGAAIVRPSLIYDLQRFPRHLSFAAEAIGRREQFTFFDDEFRCPVLADELAQAIFELCRRRLSGTWHAAGTDRVDRWWFGTRLLKAFGYPVDLARRGRSADLAGNRPADCSLDCGKLRDKLGIQLSGARQVLGQIEVED